MSSNKISEKQKAITLEEKLDVVKRYEYSKKMKNIKIATGLNESTLWTITKK